MMTLNRTECIFVVLVGLIGTRSTKFAWWLCRLCLE